MRELPYNSYFRHEYRLSVPEQLAQRMLLDFPSYIYIFRFIHIYIHTYTCIFFANGNVEHPPPDC